MANEQRVFPATIFDFNGVLVDDEQVHCDAFRQVLLPLRIEFTDQRYFHELIGFDDVGVFSLLLKEAGQNASAFAVKQLVDAKKPLYMQRAREHLPTFPGAAAIIRDRARVGPVAVVSGALRDEIELGLDSLGVREWVGHIVAAEDTVVSKPDPEGYLKGLAWVREQLGDPTAQAFVIEDSLDGIVAAKAAGLFTVAVAHSYSRAALEASEADMVFDRLDELTAETLNQLQATESS